MSAVDLSQLRPINLYNQQGTDVVTQVMIPRGDFSPTALAWGARVFFLGTDLRYTEGVLYQAHRREELVNFEP